MDIRKLQRAIVDGLEDVKAQHITVFNTEHLSSMFERVIVASGTSNRQTKALAASVRNTVKGRGMQVMATEGEDNGEWIIVDCGAAVAHIMQPAIREYYNLEEIWGGKPVRIARAETGGRLVKASEPDETPAQAARKKTSGAAVPASAPRKRAPTRKTSAAEGEKKAANRTAAFKRVAAKKAPAKKTSSRDTQAPASKTVVVKPAAKPAVKPAAKKTTRPAGKTPAAKKAAPKTTARKAPARKTPTRG